MADRREAVLVLQVWDEADHDVPLRATITSDPALLGVAPADGDVVTVAAGTTVDDVVEHLRSWLERFSEAAA